MKTSAHGICLVILGLAGLLGFGLCSVAGAQTTFRINEVSYDPSESPEEPFEFIELYNYGPVTAYLDGLVISDEGNSGTAEATFQFPGTPGGTTLPVAAGAYVLLVGDATGTTLPADWEFFGGGADPDAPGVPNLVKTAGSAADLLLGNTGDGVTLSVGTTTGGVIPCAEVIDGVSWEGGGVGDTYAMSSTVCADPASSPGYTNTGTQILTLQRCPNGVDTNNSAADFVATDRSPKAASACGDVPPVITNLHYTPCFVTAGQQASILCQVTDENNDVTAVRVYYRLEGVTPFDSTTMTPTTPPEYGAALPGRPDQSEVQYFVQTFDATGNIVRSPATAPSFLRSYRVGLQTIASCQVPSVSDSCSPSAALDKAVNVVGVVTNLPYEFSDNFFYIQQGIGVNSGIKVFTQTDSSFVPDIGDSVRVSGFVDEFNCQTEVVLFANCGTILGSNRRVRARTLASVADIDNEENESMLVTVAGPINVATAFDNTNLGQEFQINVGPSIAYVGDDTFFPDGIGYSTVPAPGMTLDGVTGVVGYRRSDTTPPRANTQITLRLEPRRDNDIDRDYTDVGDDDDLAVVPVFYLGQNTPNPFNPATSIEFAVPRAGTVALRIYAAGGKLVRTLVERHYDAATRDHAVWDGKDDSGQPAPSGMYFYRLEAAEHRATRKMLLLR